MKKPTAHHVLANSTRQRAVSALVFLVIYVFFMWYHKLRGKDYSWFTTFNKPVPPGAFTTTAFFAGSS